jgi:hypothetical protein
MCPDLKFPDKEFPEITLNPKKNKIFFAEVKIPFSSSV